MKIGESGGELNILERLLGPAGGYAVDGSAVDVVVPNGDDAAVVRFGGRLMAVTTDMIVEGRHFDRRFSSSPEIGRKAVEAATSDIVAMGGYPRQVYLAVALPTDTDIEIAEEIYRGIHAACARLGTLILGGDTTVGAAEIVITVTVIGEIDSPAHVCPRSGARSGDLLCTTGPLGVAAAGLWALVKGEAGYEELKARHRAPECRLDCVAALAPIATAMIDVSDGLASEIHHLCRQSRVGALVRGDLVPFHPAAGELSAVHGLDLLEFALSGGDDYELLYTVDPTDRDRVVGCVIGEMTADPGVHLARNGIIEPLADRGYDHCRAAKSYIKCMA